MVLFNFFCELFIYKDNRIPMHHNNFMDSDGKNKKKLPHLNEEYEGTKKNSKIQRQKNAQKKEFLKTFGNFPRHEKHAEIRDIKSQAGSDLINGAKTQNEVI